MKLSGRHGTFVFLFCAVYVLLQKCSLFGSRPATFTEIFLSPPFLAAASALGICIIILFVAGGGTRRRNDRLVPLAVILMLLGLWTSFLTRIDLEAVVTESQPLFVTSDSVRTFGGYAGRLARSPDLFIKLLTLKPEFAVDRQSLKKLTARYVLLPRDGSSPRTMSRTSDDFPVFRDWFLVSFKEHGYSPRYVLKGPKGEELDSAFVNLKIGYPGAEDYFRLMSPHTYYLRYFPDGEGASREPYFTIRVSRNKDLVLNQKAKLNEEVVFDGENISFAEVKQWTRFRIVRDYGQMVCVLGLACLGVWIVISGI